MHCTKVVIDFTLMSENQIISFFKNNSAEVCGRLSHHQMEYTYHISLRKTPWYMNRFLHFAISGLLTLKLADSAAQTPILKGEITVNDKNKNNNTSTVKGDTVKSIEGKVTGYNQSALENTLIKIQETGQTFQTNSSGKFKFELPKDFTGTQVTITFTHSGYELESRSFTLAELPIKKLIIHLYHHQHIKGKVMYRSLD